LMMAMMARPTLRSRWRSRASEMPARLLASLVGEDGISLSRSRLREL